MRLAKIYDKISSDYYDFDVSNIIGQALQTALSIIKQTDFFQTSSVNNYAKNIEVIDLGIGDGRFLELFQQKFPMAQLTGLDISAKMLALAQKKINFTPIKSGILQASRYLPSHKFDLATASFVCAYVGADNILKLANHILKPEGFVCITTSTFEAFPDVQRQIRQFVRNQNPLKRYFGTHIQQALKKTLVPENQKALIENAEIFGYKVITCQKLITKVCFEDANDFIEKGVRSGYFASIFEHSFIPPKIIKLFTKLLVRTLDLPFHDHAVVEVILLQKNSNNPHQ